MALAISSLGHQTAAWTAKIIGTCWKVRTTMELEGLGCTVTGTGKNAYGRFRIQGNGSLCGDLDLTATNSQADYRLKMTYDSQTKQYVGHTLGGKYDRKACSFSHVEKCSEGFNSGSLNQDCATKSVDVRDENRLMPVAKTGSISVEEPDVKPVRRSRLSIRGTKRLLRSDSTGSDIDQNEGNRLIESITAGKHPEYSVHSSQKHELTTSASANLSAELACMAPSKSSSLSSRPQIRLESIVGTPNFQARVSSCPSQPSTSVTPAARTCSSEMIQVPSVDAPAINAPTAQGAAVIPTKQPKSQTFNKNPFKLIFAKKRRSLNLCGIKRVSGGSHDVSTSHSELRNHILLNRGKHEQDLNVEVKRAADHEGYTSINGNFGGSIVKMLSSAGVKEYEPDVITLLAEVVNQEAHRIITRARGLGDHVSLDSMRDVLRGTQSYRPPIEVDWAQMEKLNEQALPQITGEMDWLWSHRDADVSEPNCHAALGRSDEPQPKTNPCATVSIPVARTCDPVASPASSDMDEDLLKEFAQDLAH